MERTDPDLVCQVPKQPDIPNYPQIQRFLEGGVSQYILLIVHLRLSLPLQSRLSCRAESSDESGSILGIEGIVTKQVD